MHLLYQLKLVLVAPKRDLLPLVYFPLNHSQGTFGTDPKERYENYFGFFLSAKLWHQYLFEIERLNLK